MDEFDLHFKILSVCEHLMEARCKIESMTEQEREIAVSLLERLYKETKEKENPHDI